MSFTSLRVLVLEDHLFQRSVAVNLLKQLGCGEVLEASNGTEALAVLQGVGSVDVVVCDLQMEGMDGLEFIQRISAHGQVGAIIVSSGLPGDVRRAVSQMGALLGVNMLGDTGKPLQIETLQPLLERVLSTSCEVPQPQPSLELADEQQVRRAILDQQLQAYYQPKFDLHSGAVLGVEVLARWNHPFQGVLSPTVFLPAMERSGLMDELLFCLMQQALALQRQALNLGIALDLAFNLQAAQLTEVELTLHIKRILTTHQTPCASVTFELTESGLLEVPAVSLENLVRLRMMGCRLSIDDFGAGFSSLQRLCQLPFNEIKLDAEFVRGLLHEPRCRAVIGSTLALGQTLSMSVVIEGIETAEQHQALLALGCTQGQGYWHARPMNGADLLRWLQRNAGRPVSSNHAGGHR
ncbi:MULTISPECIES: EAL domain-containing response regulator [unclassified Pseudomonas]|uniref:EAL domain-containing response regulator n=1 Tax=unclassified Pseudomonas TaxID=196821 RepID=UPI001474AB22|nr:MULTISPECIES: EAL domain-containing response regulator [unclassified Pseudomonas]NMX94848.1 EAL domain-containing response regulator [Pseudomonas sp. WS 5086]NMY48740.1 EAL domain-containing response regulator [Pseudomonas sp. WS 5027]